MNVVVEKTESNRALLAELLRLAGPLMLGNLFFSLQIIIDRAFLSRFHPEAPGAALASGMVIWIFIVCLQNTAGFVVTFVAQYAGARRFREIGPMVWQGVWIGVFGGLLALTAAPFAGLIFAAIGHTERMQGWEVEYFRCLCLTALPVSVQAAATAFFSGRGQTAPAIWINFIGCAVNAVLDPLLIFGAGGLPALGVTGAGVATVAACCGSCGFGIWWMTRPRFESEFRIRSGWRLNAALVRQLLRFGGPNGLQSAADIIAWTVFTLMVGWIGAAELAATNAVFVINSIFFIPMVGLAQAAGVFVGQRLGENRPSVAERGVWIGVALTVGFMGCMGFLAALSPRLVLALFENHDNPTEWQAVADAVPTLLWYLAAYSIFDGLNIMLAFSLRGAGDTRFVSLTYVLVGGLVLVAPMWWAVGTGGSLYDAWTIATIYLIVLTAVIFARWRYGPWKSMRVIEPAVV